MKDVEIAKELKSDIDYNQTQLKNAICNHQVSFDIIFFSSRNNNENLIFLFNGWFLIKFVSRKTSLEHLRQFQSNFNAFNKE